MDPLRRFGWLCAVSSVVALGALPTSCSSEREDAADDDDAASSGGNSGGRGATSATGGSGGKGGSANPSAGTGGAPSGTGYTVRAGGYVTTGSWHGYAWTYAATNGSTITPSDFSSVGTGEALCVSGSVAPDASYSGYAMLGVNLNQAEASGAPANTVVPTVNGITVNVTNPGGSPLRVQLSGPNAATDPNDIWCAPISGSGGPIPFSSFNTACWDGSGTPYASQPITALAILVPGDGVEAVPFEFCLNRLEQGAASGSTCPSDYPVDCMNGRCCPAEYPICDGGCGSECCAEPSQGCPSDNPVDCGDGRCCPNDYPVCDRSCGANCCATALPPLSTEEAAVGAWAGSAVCGAGRNEFVYYLCPGGRLRGAETVGSFDYLACGTWAASGDVVSMDYTAIAVDDPVVSQFPTEYDWTYSPTTDTLSWIAECPMVLNRLVGGVTEEDCGSSTCTAGGSGTVQCGTDCDCGRCWYCESGTCRYGGEGPYGCYRGCGF